MSWVLLVLGLLLWSSLHLFRSVAPDGRAALEARFGPASKGLIALGILVSLGLVILGYRATGYVPIWSPPAFFTHVNNLLMVLALYMYLSSATKPGTAFAFGNLKNPQLTGFKLWAAAHLLVNGDLAAMILFAGLLAWAVLEVVFSKRVPSMVDRSKAPISSPWTHLGLVLAAFAAVSALHAALGRWPFG
ncbi:MAG: NnrU family protein [Pseudomonadota bacterium]